VSADSTGSGAKRPHNGSHSRRPPQTTPTNPVAADVAADVASAAAPASSTPSAAALSTSPTLRTGAADVAARLLNRLRQLGDVVVAIGAAFALPPARLIAAEAIDRLELTVSLRIDELLTREDDLVSHVGGWYDALGADLTLDLSLTGLDPDAEPVAASLRAKRDPQGALRGFLTAAREVAETQGGDVGVALRLAIGKMAALAEADKLFASRPEWFGEPEALAQTTIAVFYHHAAWERLLAPGALPLWEQRGLAREGGRACVVVCDAPGYLAGLALDVVGAQQTEPIPWLTVSQAAWRRFDERDAQTRRLRAEEGSWASAPAVITPDRLAATLRLPGLEATAQRLAQTRAALAAAYLASGVEGALGDAAGPTLRFAGPRPAVCHLRTVEDATAPTSAAGEADDALTRLAAWAYRDGAPEKLAIARECLGAELAAGAQVTLAQVAQAAIPALEAAKANFTLYIRRNTAQYFALRATAQDAVATYSEATRKAVSDLTGDVVDTTYRTLGLLVAVIVADLIQPNVTLIVLRLAAFVLMAYVALILGVVMRARHDRFALEAAALHERLAAMPELTEAERARIRQPASAADTFFQRYFRQSLYVYIGLGALGLLAFILLLTPLAHALAPAATHASSH